MLAANDAKRVLLGIFLGELSGTWYFHKTFSITQKYERV
jgi:hypothetical protein